MKILPFAEVAGKILVLVVYDFDRFSKHDQIGLVKVPLSSIDLCNTIEEWRDIESPESDAEKTIVITERSRARKHSFRKLTKI
ncbi:unnamed protein product [Protopolystoma xenopodis]|uniref:C2 domain-containing protein n=1 Tax=Protopolystoma xenopodis TaxID=117903 RepID=A0A3S5FBT1_9PLAT|nr:unnamed protein product [Protopolystoma xenopodis]